MTEEKAPYGNSSEIVAINNQGLADVTDDIIASAERRVAQVEKIVTLALKRTNATDWIDQNGKPYLAASGAEKVARLFGISWKVVKSEKVFSTDEKGQFYFYEFIGEFTLGRDKIETVGTCSSKDQFFAKSKGEFKPLSEIDETNIRKAAYTNMVANGITRMLGIRNLTWAEVEKAGIQRSGAAKVDYAAGGAGGGLASEPQRKLLYAVSKEHGLTEELVKNYLADQYGIDSSKDIKREWVNDIKAWMESFPKPSGKAEK